MQAEIFLSFTIQKVFESRYFMYNWALLLVSSKKQALLRSRGSIPLVSTKYTQSEVGTVNKVSGSIPLWVRLNNESSKIVLLIRILSVCGQHISICREELVRVQQYSTSLTRHVKSYVVVWGLRSSCKYFVLNSFLQDQIFCLIFFYFFYQKYLQNWQNMV